MNADSQVIGETYSFSEVCTLTQVKPYVLRFWESEFSQIDPVQLPDGDKLYHHSDLEVVEVVRELLFKNRHSIPEVKHILNTRSIQELRSELVLDQAKLKNSVKLSSQDLSASHLNQQSEELSQELNVRNKELLIEESLMTLNLAEEKLIRLKTKIDTMFN
jgi:DNA-binding transcriptional MerR regulator